ncbi:uncharacterized protein G2W53_007731 [Senna tora]|uniref:Uncharacterized protein n=1 Tax=Senna tora TaxID=362788 RepID=A0A835CEI4_9FABA|nr:uncharacterized protein G2W53_007731 [Senna tora]
MAHISIKAHHHTIVPPLHTYFVEVHLPLIVYEFSVALHYKAHNMCIMIGVDRLALLNPVHPLMAQMFDVVMLI